MAVPQTVEGGDNGGNSRHQLHGFGLIRFQATVGRLRIVQAEHGNGRAKDVHRAASLWRAAQELNDARGRSRSATKLAFRVVQFTSVRQTAVPKEINHFLEVAFSASV